MPVDPEGQMKPSAMFFVCVFVYHNESGLQRTICAHDFLLVFPVWKKLSLPRLIVTK